MNSTGILMSEHLTFLRIRPTYTGVHICRSRQLIIVTIYMFLPMYSTYASYGFINIQRIIEESIIKHVSGKEAPNITLSMRVRWGVGLDVEHSVGKPEN